LNSHKDLVVWQKSIEFVRGYMGLNLEDRI